MFWRPDARDRSPTARGAQRVENGRRGQPRLCLTSAARTDPRCHEACHCQNLFKRTHSIAAPDSKCRSRMLRLLAAISALAEKLDPQKACSVGRVRFPESREERALMASASMRETRVASSRPTERTPIEKLRVSFAVIRPRNSCAMCVLYCIDWLHLAFARKGVAKSGEKS